MSRLNFEHRFRIGQFGQQIAQLLTGVGVPWAWHHIDYTICCDGSTKFVFSGSYFPSHDAYIGGVLPKEHVQSGLINFVFAGAGARAPGGAHFDNHNCNRC